MLRDLFRAALLGLVGWVLVAAASPPVFAEGGLGLAWELSDHETPANVVVGRTLSVLLTVRNTGSVTWQPELRDHLAYHWRSPEGEMVVLDGQRTELPQVVRPGEQVRLEARLGSPPGPGKWLLEWAMVREGVRWYSRPESGLSVQWEISAQKGDSPTAAGPRGEGLAWELVRRSNPRVMWMHRRAEVPVTVRNSGWVTWSPEEDDHLAYHWRSADGAMVVRDGRRTALAHAVPPGEEISLRARVSNPPATGSWVLEWAMVREGVRWYSRPEEGMPVQGRVRIWYRCALLQIGFLLASVVATVLVLAWRDGRGRQVVLLTGPVVWFLGAVLVIAYSFEDLSGVVIDPVVRGMGVSAAALAVLPVVLAPRRLRAVAAGVATLALSLVAAADLVYLRFFGNVVPPEAVFAWRQMGQIQDSIVSLLLSSDVWLVPAACAGVVLAVAWPRPRVIRRMGWRSWKAKLVLVVLLVPASIPACRGLRVAWAEKGLRDQVFEQQQTIAHLGWLGTHAFEVMRAVQERLSRGRLSDIEHDRLVEFIGRRHDWAGLQSRGFGAAQGANLILIQAESLHHWVIDARVGEQEVAPFLNALQRRGIFFSQVFDQSAQGRSSDGEFAALNAHHAMARGAVVFRRASNRFVALPGLLQEAGYSTLSAHAFDRGFWNRAAVHPRFGFQRSLFRRELGDGEMIGWGLADGVFFERVLPHVADLPRPFFAFLITLGLHHPFDEFPVRHRVLDVGDLEDSPLGNYIHSMHYLDRCLRELFSGLEAHGLLENTVVAVYSDHESGLNIDERVKELARAGTWNAAARTRLRRVPYFVLLPDGALSGEVSALGGHISVTPTLLHLLGIRPPFGFAGVPLVELHPFPAVMADGSAVLGDVLLARTPDLPPGGLCYSFPEGASLPRESCDELDRLAQEELWASRTAVSRDLVWDLAQSRRP